MKINTLSEPSPPLPSSREKEMQVQINNLSEKIEKIGKYVIKSIQELKDSLNKVEAVLKLEGIKAGLATATPQDQKELLGERLFPEIQKMNSPLAGKLTGMMLEKSNEEILQMIENPDYLTKEVKTHLDLLMIENPDFLTKEVKAALDLLKSLWRISMINCLIF